MLLVAGDSRTTAVAPGRRSGHICFYLDVTIDRSTELGALRAKVFRGLADPTRLAIVESLLAGRLNVGEIVEATDLPQPTVSAQLACLYECGLVRREQEGRFVYYDLAGSDVRALLLRVDALLERTAEQIAACVNYGRRWRDDVRTPTVAARPVLRRDHGTARRRGRERLGSR